MRASRKAVASLAADVKGGPVIAVAGTLVMLSGLEVRYMAIGIGIEAEEAHQSDTVAQRPLSLNDVW